MNVILTMAAGFNLLSGLFAGSIENIAVVVLLMGSRLNIDSIEAVTALREEKESDDVTFEESIHEWKEVGPAR